MKIFSGSLLVCLVISEGSSSLLSNYRRKELPGGGVGFLPQMRRGRNSKELLDDSSKSGVRGTKLPRGRTDVTALLADLRQKLAEVTSESFDDNVVEKSRAPKENKSKFNIEQHNFSLEEDDRSQGVAVPSGSQQQFYTQQQQQQYYQQQQFNQQKFSQTQPNVAARQFVQGRGESAALFNQFGDAMGPDASTDPEANKYPTQPQLNPRQQDGAGEDVRCIKKVMQVEETVYEEKVKCQHTFSEKCHDTFITDYVPTQEKKCETSFEKNCHIRYKPMMFEEDVEICNEPLQKICNNNTVGQGETVCNTHYETVCETRYKEHEVEQDEPVCEMVVEKKCKAVTIPVPTGGVFRRRRQVGPPGVELTSGIPDSPAGVIPAAQDDSDNVVNIGEECEEWPVQKCELQKKKVTKTNPETACEKIPKEICAPSGCIVQPSKKACRTETRQLLQNIPSEECDLEPQENCKMETVLVPRLIQQPNCIKVPKEICVNERTNPKKIKKPVVKEWCYKPSDLQSPTSRLALSQFFNKS